MDWQIGNVWSCPAVVPGDFRWFPVISTGRATRNPLGNSYDFCTWTRQKADRNRLGSDLGADPKRICIRSELTTPNWTQSGPKMDPTLTQNRPK